MLSATSTARRGKIQGMDRRVNGATQIDAIVPLSEMFGYATDLRSKHAGPRPVFHGARATSDPKLPKSIAAGES